MIFLSLSPLLLAWMIYPGVYETKTTYSYTNQKERDLIDEAWSYDLSSTELRLDRAQDFINYTEFQEKYAQLPLLYGLNEFRYELEAKIMFYREILSVNGSYHGSSNFIYLFRGNTSDTDYLGEIIGINETRYDQSLSFHSFYSFVDHEFYNHTETVDPPIGWIDTRFTNVYYCQINVIFNRYYPSPDYQGHPTVKIDCLFSETGKLIFYSCDYEIPSHYYT